MQSTQKEKQRQTMVCESPHYELPTIVPAFFPPPELPLYPGIQPTEINLSHPDQGVKFLREIWDKNLIGLQEQIIVVFLNRANYVIGWRCLAMGGLSMAQLDVKVLAFAALQYMASSIVMAHNHPSGNTTPSINDIKVTRTIKEMCKVIDVTLLDHLIITKKDHFSFSESGML